QLADQLNSLGRTVGIVAADVIDFAPVNAALLVDHIEISGVDLAVDSVRRGRPAIGIGIADLNFGIGYAGPILTRRVDRTPCEQQASGAQRACEDPRQSHNHLPFVCQVFQSPLAALGIARNRCATRTSDGPNASAVPITPRGIAYMNRSIANP